MRENILRQVVLEDVETGIVVNDIVMKEVDIREQLNTVTVERASDHLPPVSIVIYARCVQVTGPNIASSIFIRILDISIWSCCKQTQFLSATELIETDSIRPDLTLLGKVVFDRADN